MWQQLQEELEEVRARLEPYMAEVHERVGWNLEGLRRQLQPYTVELITDLPEDAAISFYKQGDFTDLCAGPHLMSTGKVGKAYKLLNLAGAYWRGSEKNKMLTRIYATAFAKKEELEEYLQILP